MRSIAIFGGTFDPIHNGHIQTSLSIQSHFNFERFLFLPCKTPVLKTPALANSQQRIKMIELAIADLADFAMDLREIERDTPSYMVETLTSFRLQYPDASITLIIGYDAFLSLSQWYQWKRIITLANLLVINRNEFKPQDMPRLIQDFLKKYQSKDEMAILNKHSGAVILFDAGHYEVSSTLIREEIREKKDISSKLPNAVYDYIKAEALYQ